MKHEGLADEFQSLADAVIKRYRGEYRRTLERTPDQELRQKAQIALPVHGNPIILGFLGDGDRREEIGEMPEFEAACENALQFDIIDQYHGEDGEGAHTIQEIIRRFLTDLLGSEDLKFDYSADHFIETYEAYETQLFSETLPERTFICLQGLELKGDLDVVELGGEVTIRPIDDHDIEILSNMSPTESLFIDQNREKARRMGVMASGPKIKYILETEFRIRKGTNEAVGYDDYVRERSWRIRNSITALRLINNSETVNYAQKITEPMGRWQRSMGGGGSANNRVAWMANYELSENDIGDLESVYTLLQSKDFGSIDRDLKMAVDRFNAATLRSDWRVELGDMVIILEALLSKQQRIRQHQLAQRAAILLGNSKKDKEEILEDITDLYDLRSGVWGVAHGGGDKEVDDQSEVVEWARSYASECLIKILQIEQEMGGLNNVLKRMDEKVDESILNIEFP